MYTSSSVDRTIRPRSVETSIGRPTTTGTRESTGEAVTDGDGVRVDDTAAEGLMRAGSPEQEIVIAWARTIPIVAPVR
jgi:hypothetical protein